MDRRSFLRGTSLAMAGSMAGNFDLSPLSGKSQKSSGPIEVDPTPQFDISPYFHLQFMEPLGATEGSVEAAWNYDEQDWRSDLMEAVQYLGPDVIRFGGIFSRYYKWREGVGPLISRPPMYNHLWGGMETNRVGTHEFVDLCRRAEAEPLITVNFLSDGHKQYWQTVHGENRRGDAEEAADWVAYANDPDNARRRSHGIEDPYNIKLWQIGNETSYGGGFEKEEAIKHTVEFAQAMKERDPSIELIGWGDGGAGEDFWAPDMLNRAGEHLDYIAMHMMGMVPQREDTVLKGQDYQQNPEQAWEELVGLTDIVEDRIGDFKSVVADARSDVGIAITEGHVSFEPHNANPILTEWLSSVYHARTMNIYQRNGDMVKMCTGADLCGTRWTVNAIRMGVPHEWAGTSYLLPVGAVMRLFNLHNGSKGIEVTRTPTDLDIAASREGDTIYLHVVNLNFDTDVEAELGIRGESISEVTVHEIAPEDVREHVYQDQPDVFEPEEIEVETSGRAAYRFPATSVSAVEITLA